MLRMSASRRVLAAALVALCLLAAGVSGEDELDCYDGPFESVLLDGCTDDCRSVSYTHLTLPTNREV